MRNSFKTLGRRPSDVVVAAALMGLLTIGLMGLSFARTNVFDEGVVAYFGWAVAHGEWPYRDFWTLYGPGQFFCVGALSKLGAGPLLATRLLDLAAKLTLTWSIFLLSRRLGAGRWSCFVLSLAGLTLLTAGFFGYPLYPSLMLALFAFLAADRSREDPDWGVAAGALLAMALYYRQDIGAFGVLSLLPILAFRRPAAAVRCLGSLLVLSAMLWAPVLWHAGLAEVIDQLFGFSLKAYRSAYGLPFPPLAPSLGALADSGQAWSQVYLVPAVAVAIAVWFRRLPMLAWMVLIFSALLYNQVLNRQDGIHRLPYLLVFLPFAALALAKLPAASAWLLAGLLLPIYGRAPLAELGRLTRSSAQLEIVDLDAWSAARYVREHSGPEDRIFVANKRMDQGIINDVLFYALARRKAGTRWVIVVPMLTTGPEIQRKMIGELNDARVDWVVRCDQFNGSNESNASSASGSGILDDWIGTHFREVAVFGDYRILGRAEGAVGAPRSSFRKKI